MSTPTTTPVTGEDDEEGIVEVIGSGPKALHTVSATPATDQPPAAPVTSSWRSPCSTSTSSASAAACSSTCQGTVESAAFVGWTTL